MSQRRFLATEAKGAKVTFNWQDPLNLDCRFVHLCVAVAATAFPARLTEDEKMIRDTAAKYSEVLNASLHLFLVCFSCPCVYWVVGESDASRPRVHAVRALPLAASSD